MNAIEDLTDRVDDRKPFRSPIERNAASQAFGNTRVGETKTKCACRP